MKLSRRRPKNSALGVPLRGEPVRLRLPREEPAVEVENESRQKNWSMMPANQKRVTTSRKSKRVNYIITLYPYIDEGILSLVKCEILYFN